MTTSPRRAVATCAITALIAASCAGSDSSTAADPLEVEIATDVGSIRLVSAEEGDEILIDAPDDLIILDVRTPEEFAEGHIEGAIMIDFYDDDFADQLAGLDPDASYLLYCRSGNRSGQTTDIMETLGFTDVADVDGGVIAWADAGLPLVAG